MNTSSSAPASRRRVLAPAAGGQRLSVVGAVVAIVLAIAAGFLPAAAHAAEPESKVEVVDARLEAPEPLHPDQQEILRYSAQLRVKDDVKPGDTFTVAYSPHLNRYGTAAPGTSDNLTIERDGKPFLTESYDPESNVSTFTFGEAVDGLKDRNAQFEIPLFLDPAVVQKSGRTEVAVIVDEHQLLQKELDVDYLDYVDRSLSLKSHLYNVDPEAGTYTVNSVVNPYGQKITNAVLFGGPQPDRETSAVFGGDVDVKVYRIDDPKDVPDSVVTDDVSEFVDVTDQVKKNSSRGEGYEIHFPETIDTPYLVVYNGTFDPSSDVPLNTRHTFEGCHEFAGFDFMYWDNENAPFGGSGSGEGYMRTGDVTVEYVTVDGTVLEETSAVKTQAPVGEAYTTEQKTFEGYEFVKLADNSAPANGTVTEQAQHVIYVYKPIEPTPPTTPEEPGDSPPPTPPGNPGEPTPPTTPGEPTPPTTPGEPTEPSEPAEPSEPQKPEQPAEPMTPEQPQKPGAAQTPAPPAAPPAAAPAKPTASLANTGASVLWIAGLGALLVAAGALALRRRNF
ncbi:LPXTG-domain-containing protein cell wall anchor domain [Corynebacterium otitidis ATCC 51513]|uniref:LPXTG-domain-containing protein cell wall anchor domain n=1 Tax=Corynebacterium otitidis ATCC 51513 TaxID=883169 RepID=K0YDY7_9CORY|nr:Ig-like domain-containing protein [Corynebacterium otitidis]EJZ81378.1 LPXTG-domain-containing protein cell wall anchor domain [Corynebacterium otitidis ATCC 51513]